MPVPRRLLKKQIGERGISAFLRLRHLSALLGLNWLTQVDLHSSCETVWYVCMCVIADEWRQRVFHVWWYIKADCYTRHISTTSRSDAI